MFRGIYFDLKEREDGTFEVLFRGRRFCLCTHKNDAEVIFEALEKAVMGKMIGGLAAKKKQSLGSSTICGPATLKRMAAQHRKSMVLHKRASKGAPFNSPEYERHVTAAMIHSENAFIMSEEARTITEMEKRSREKDSGA